MTNDQRPRTIDQRPSDGNPHAELKRLISVNLLGIPGGGRLGAGKFPRALPENPRRLVAGWWLVAGGWLAKNRPGERCGGWNRSPGHGGEAELPHRRSCRTT